MRLSMREHFCYLNSDFWAIFVRVKWNGLPTVSRGSYVHQRISIDFVHRKQQPLIKKPETFMQPLQDFVGVRNRLYESSALNVLC